MGALASSNFDSEIETLINGYKLCASSEGKSKNSIDIVINSVRYFYEFLENSKHINVEITDIDHHYIREFILYLKQRKCFEYHQLNRTQDRGLSEHTINCYLRSLRIFFSWLVSEDILCKNPFDRVKIPRPTKKVIVTFSDAQIQNLLDVLDTKTPEGYRNMTIIMTLLDTAMRVSELCTIKLEDIRLDDGMIKVLGKGNKERFVPMGRQVQRLLWQYINRCRPEPVRRHGDLLFLTEDGRPLTKDRIDKVMSYYGQKAEIKGVRCSPHTLRHTAAVRFLRNGGDVFTLQRLLGHTSLEMTRRYCELADIDVKQAHITASPVDNLDIIIQRKGRRNYS
ncbi:MAG: tyrosine-type recombinase/integrase [Eubacteriales bacterium]